MPELPNDKIRGHSLLPDSEARSLPPLGSTDGQGGGAYAQVRLFTPAGAWTWYLTEFDGEDTAFGYCESGLGPDCSELGYVSVRELAETTNRFGLAAVERDIHFVPRPLRDAIRADGHPVPSYLDTDLSKDAGMGRLGMGFR